jgi:monovalent cation:H+ antiporter-2, CPA2 family
VLPGNAITAPLVATAALSMALTPLLLLLQRPGDPAALGTREAPEREPDAIDEHAPVLVAGFGAFGSTVGRLLGRTASPPRCWT